MTVSELVKVHRVKRKGIGKEREKERYNKKGPPGRPAAQGM